MPILHDATPPQHWPAQITFLTRSRLSASIPNSHIPYILSPKSAPPVPISSYSHVKIKPITDPKHPANGQNGLYATKKIKPRELIVPYLGMIHARIEGEKTIHDESDYDLSLLRISIPSSSLEGDSEDSSGFTIIDIGIDASTHGNVARTVNDYRGIGARPNAEFRQITHPSTGGTGREVAVGMEVWSLEKGVNKGEEILVSYGKGWWNARNG
ncbi:hypothetical protein FIBSPDRAFT_867210 [Athelia psychrophila]|uniref:SET domain-containing protein n=1 Tax=Athelia psychrophila TaxID=1759441 RepID=A0A166E788_9AGAM|nr:hypothetical protein FIBSPDRAFT_867210 [Fibularhizoctonia sp. CBS 109695]